MSALTFIIKKNDINIFYFLNKKMHCRILDWLMKLITEIGSTVFAVLVASFFLIHEFIFSEQNISFLLALNLVGSQIVIQVIKRLVNRPRPYKTFNWVIAVKPPACKYSFPSGHTCSAFSIALVLSTSFQAIGFIFVMVAVLVGFSRIYLGYHYPTDVLIGIFIAYMIFIPTTYLLAI